MKDGLIRLKVNDNIFYDSIIKQYRYRMHCPECGKKIPDGCRCYDDLDVLLGDIDNGIADFTCCAKCCLINGDWDNLGEAMQMAGLEKDIKECLSINYYPDCKDLTESEAQEVLDILTDGGDFDSPSGVACTI